MSSTYAHYQGPSSLPSDYAILSSLQNEPDQDSDLDSDSDSDKTYYRPAHPTIAWSSPQPLETTPLLSIPPPPCIEETIDNVDSYFIFWEELFILAKYALPVFAYVRLIICGIHILTPPSTHVLEYSLVVVSVVSIGHLSTSALAAISLGSMTASVSGFSIIQGMANALDTLLPSAWTSPHPELVGLWAQRMSEFFVSISVKISH